MFKYSLALLALAVGLSACTQKKNDNGNSNQNQPKIIVPKDGKPTPGLTLQQQVIQNVSALVIMQTYKDLAFNAGALRDQVKVLKLDKTQENLDKAGELWKAIRVSWEQSEAFLFGPVESLSVDPLIDTWPLNLSNLDAILTSTDSITPETLRTLGTNLKGFHAAEYLIFGNGVASNRKDVNALTDRELEYLVSTTIVLAEDTARLAKAWVTNEDPDDNSSQPYVMIIMNPNLDNKFYSSEQSVIAEFVKGMAAIADEVANGKLNDPLGASVGQADPTAEESPFSWNSISDFSNNIRSIRMIYSGESNHGNAGYGVQALLAKKDPALAEQVLKQIDASIQKIQDIAGPSGMPFGKALFDTEGRERIKAAQSEVNALFATLEQKVLPIFQK
jgi:putative iron-regulated protein